MLARHRPPRHAFEPSATGGTDYTWSISFKELSVLGRPLIALAARLFDRALAAQATALRRYLEALPPDAPPPDL